MTLTFRASGRKKVRGSFESDHSLGLEATTAERSRNQLHARLVPLFISNSSFQIVLCRIFSQVHNPVWVFDLAFEASLVQIILGAQGDLNVRNIPWISAGLFWLKQRPFFKSSTRELLFVPKSLERVTHKRQRVRTGSDRLPDVTVSLVAD